MLSKNDRQLIKQVISSPQWSSIEATVKELTDKIKDEPVLYETEWETLKATLFREGQIRGISRLIQELYIQAQNHES